MGRTLREALNGDALGIFLINPEARIVKIKEDGSKGRVVSSEIPNLKQVEIGGEHGNILINFDDKKKEIIVYQIKDDLTIEVTTSLKLSSVIDQIQMTSTMAISPCGEYILVHSSKSVNKITRQLMFFARNSEIKLCGILDLSSSSGGLNYFFSSLAYLKTVGDELIFKGITWDHSPPSTVVTLVYNKTTGEFKELQACRKTIGDNGFLKLTRQGETLYGIGFENCRLLKMI